MPHLLIRLAWPQWPGGRRGRKLERVAVRRLAGLPIRERAAE
jgi:hypothetical protein